ncbi:hypothetical protein C8F01DRAFT_1090307 [Mycena amicta]|nr:hypothetical protein C8F01DRAFT_1090307 [Mycena amicta]
MEISTVEMSVVEISIHGDIHSGDAHKVDFSTEDISMGMDISSEVVDIFSVEISMRVDISSVEISMRMDISLVGVDISSVEVDRSTVEVDRSTVEKCSSVDISRMICIWRYPPQWTYPHPVDILHELDPWRNGRMHAKPLGVNVSSIRSALKWIKTQNPLYQDFKINEPIEKIPVNSVNEASTSRYDALEQFSPAANPNGTGRPSRSRISGLQTSSASESCAAPSCHVKKKGQWYFKTLLFACRSLAGWGFAAITAAFMYSDNDSLRQSVAGSAACRPYRFIIWPPTTTSTVRLNGNDQDKSLTASQHGKLNDTGILKQATSSRLLKWPPSSSLPPFASPPHYQLEQECQDP